MDASDRWAEQILSGPDASDAYAESILAPYQPAAAPTRTSDFMRGMSAGFGKSYAGIKKLFKDLSPEEQKQLEEQQAYLEKESPISMAGLGAAIGEAPYYLPVAAIPGGGLAGLLGRALASGVIGGATTPGTIEQRGMGAAASAVGQPLGEVAGTVAGRVAEGLMRVPEPLFKSGRENIVGRILQSQVGKSSPEVAATLEAYQPLIPGSMATASEAAPMSGGLSGMTQWARGLPEMAERYNERARQNFQARQAAMRGIAGTEEDLALAKQARYDVTHPMYEAAMEQYAPVNASLTELLARPSMKAGMRRAEGMSAEMGQPISQEMRQAIISGEMPGEMQGYGLDMLKKGLDAYANKLKVTDPAKADLVKNTIKDFEAWREANIPEYNLAQSKYAEMSRPINQMQIGQALYNKLYSGLSDYTQEALGERPSVFAETLARPEKFEQLAKSATQFKGINAKNVMTDEQLKTLSNVATELASKQAAQQAGKMPGSDTFRNFAAQNIAERLGMTGKLSPSWISRVPGLAGLIAKSDADLRSDLAEALLDPYTTARLLRREPTGIARALQSPFINRGAGLTGASVASQRY